MRNLTLAATALAALALGVAGCGDDEAAPPATTEPMHTRHTSTAAETTSTTPTTTPATPPRTIAIAAEQGRPEGGIKTFTVRKGERVAIVVSTDVGESVHLHGYWLETPVVAGEPARIVFTATTPGRFEIELHAPDAVLGTVQVEP